MVTQAVSAEIKRLMAQPETAERNAQINALARGQATVPSSATTTTASTTRASTAPTASTGSYHPPATVIPGQGGTILVTPIQTTEPAPQQSPLSGGGTSTVNQLIGGGGTTQQTVQTPDGSLESTTISGQRVISGGTSILGPSGRVVGGSYEAGAGSGGGRTYMGPARETPVIRDVGWGTRIQVADALTKFGYNPYQIDPSQKTAYDATLQNLQNQQTTTQTYITDAQTSIGNINESIRNIQGSPSDSTWTVIYYDDKIGKEITLKDLSQKETVRLYEQQRTKTEQNLRDYANQANDIKRNIAVIGGYKESGYTIKSSDEGYTFGFPKASEVYVWKHGKELSGVALTSASFMKSPLALGTLFSGVQYAITGDEKVRQSELESLSEYALGLDESIKKGEYFQKVVTSPAMVEGVYMPLVMMGAGALFTEGATIAKTSLSGVTGRATEFFAPVAEKLAPITTRVSPLVKYTGESFKAIGGQKILQTEIKYGLYATMEAPGLIETARTHPERVGGMLGSSLFGWELGWGAMEYGAKIKIPSGEQAYYKYGKTQPTPTDIYFKDTGRTTYIDIKEPYPQARVFTEKTPGTVTTMEEYPKRGRLEMYEMQKPRTSIEIPASYEQEVTRVGSKTGESTRPGFQEFIRSEEATQPLPGAKRFTTKGMTEEERFAFEYKEPKPRITPEESELQSLSESFNKSFNKGKKGLQEFIRSEEGTQPLIGIKPQEETLGRLTPKKQIGDTLDIIETQLYKPSEGKLLLTERTSALPSGKLIMEEPGKGRLTMTEFTPTAEMKYDLMLSTKTGLATPTSTLPYPGDGAGNLYESMPGTKAQAIKSQELIHKPYDISLRPKYKTQGEAIEKIQSYYGEPAKPTSLTGAEPVSEKGVFALDTKAEENIFYKEISGAEGKKDFVFDLGKTGVVKKEAVVVNVKGQTKVFTGEDIRGFVKEQNKTSLLRNIGEQPEKPAYTITPDKHTPLRFTEKDFVKQPRYEPGPRTDSPLISKPPKLRDESGNLIETAKEPQNTFTYELKGLKDKTNTLMREEATGLNKAGLREQPRIYSKAVLENAIKSPGGSATYYGKQFRETMRVKTDTSVPVGTRPETGWAKYLGERQDAKMFIEKPKTYVLPELEKPLKLMKGETTSPNFTKVYTAEEMAKGLRYEPGYRSDNFLMRKPSEPFSIEGETIGRQTYVTEPLETKPLTEKTSFKSSGLYESPDLNTTYRLTSYNPRELALAEKGVQESRYWEGTRPRMKTTQRLSEGSLHLLTGARQGEGQGMLTASGVGLLAGLGLLSIPRADQQVDTIYSGDLLSGTRSIFSTRQNQDSLLGITQIQSPDTGQDTGQRQDQGLLQLQQQKQDLIQRQEEIQEQIQEPDLTFRFDTITDTTTTYEPPPPPREPTKWNPPNIPRKKKDEETPEKDYLKETKPDESYDVYVKERSMYEGKIRKPTRFTRVNRGPLSYKDALSLGGEVTDTTSAISFRLKKTKGAPEKPDRQLQDFSSRAQKFTQQGDTIIEKAEYRMDTQGEIQGISALGWSKRKRSGKTNGGLLSNISTRSGSPRNKSTGLFSSGNKLKENFLFRKKKNGGKKDAYY